jgi:hypothetical protein
MQGRSCLCLQVQRSSIHECIFFAKKNSKETSSDFHSLPSGKLT